MGSCAPLSSFLFDASIRALRALEGSHLPYRLQPNNAFLPLFLLDFISPPVTPYPLSRAQCCPYAFSTAAASFSASGRGSPMMIWTLGVRDLPVRWVHGRIGSHG